MRSLRTAIAAVIGFGLGFGFGGAPARAEDFWSSATEDPGAEVARRNYEREMQTGDEYAVLAAQSGINSRDQRRLLNRAILAYQNAALARPDAPEPHFRVGQVIDLFFINCDHATPLCGPGGNKPTLAALEAEHWTAFERLAPLDPRIDREFLFARALAHTHAAAVGPEKVAHAHIAAALDDYKASLRRVAPAAQSPSLQVLFGNMAETSMMLGDLESAILDYREAIRHGQDTSTLYGLAVALDRDEQGANAREIMRALGPQAFESFKTGVAAGGTFYVPEGEVFYYLALAEESLGQPDQAIGDWDHFILSGAHPEFQPRAKANRDALKAGRGRRAPVKERAPERDDDEMFAPEKLHK